jgi:hypothetical protein
MNQRGGSRGSRFGGAGLTVVFIEYLLRRVRINRGRIEDLGEDP